MQNKQTNKKEHEAKQSKTNQGHFKCEIKVILFHWRE